MLAINAVMGGTRAPIVGRKTFARRNP